MKKFTTRTLPPGTDRDAMYTPLAFPGKYPTRISYHIEFVDKKRKPVSYIGKPSIPAALRLRKLYQEHANVLRQNRKGTILTMRATEFDRGHVFWDFRIVQALLPSQVIETAPRQTTQQNVILCGFYHHWTEPGITHPFSEKFYRKKLAGFAAPFWSPQKTLKLSAVEEFKTWLVAHGLTHSSTFKKPKAKVPYKKEAPPRPPDVPIPGQAVQAGHVESSSCRACGLGLSVWISRGTLVGNTQPVDCSACGTRNNHRISRTA